MGLETINATNYSAARFAGLKTTLAKNGLTVDAKGNASRFGKKITVAYLPATQVLSIIVVHGPHLGSYQKFVNKLKALVTEQA